MRWNRLFILLGSVLVVAAILTLSALVILHRRTTPVQRSIASIDFSSLRLEIEQVNFQTADGVRLSGWYVAGRKDRPTILLAHDFGEDKSAALNLLIPLTEQGFSCLAWDARGHGSSEGASSTLGVKEKQDVIGAADYALHRAGSEDPVLGIYGVGMGAFASVLAAADRRDLKVLVLDGLYPDAAYPLRREWSNFGRILSPLLGLSMGVSVSGNRAADRLPGLTGRDLLFIAPADDARLAAEIASMHRSVPSLRDTESSLVTLPVTRAKPLYGGDLDRYQQHVLRFFIERFS